jgi:hypothetical protein
MKAHPRSAFGAQYSRQRRRLFGPPKPAQAGLEPRPSAPSRGRHQRPGKAGSAVAPALHRGFRIAVQSRNDTA